MAGTDTPLTAADVRITMRDVYTEVRASSETLARVSTTLELLVRGQEVSNETSKDHEQRLRVLEAEAITKSEYAEVRRDLEAVKLKVYAASGLSGFIIVATAVWSAFKR
jgi:hypothetical protein